MSPKPKHRISRIFLSVVAALLVVSIAGYFILQSVVRSKVEATLRSLPAPFVLSYTSIQPDLLGGSLLINGLTIRLTPGGDTLHRHELSIDRLRIGGIHFLSLLSSHSLHLGSIRLEGCRADLDEELLDKPFPFPKMKDALPYRQVLLDQAALTDVVVQGWRVAKGGRKETMSFEGSLEVHSVRIDDLNRALGSMNLGNGGSMSLGDRGKGDSDSANLHIGAIRLLAKEAGYIMPGAYERVRIKNAELDSRNAMLRIGEVAITPTVDRLELGRIKGVQTDVVDARCENIHVEGLDIMALSQHRLTADGIKIASSKINIFRDRRLRRETDEKPLPVDFLKSLPVSLRVKSVKFGASSFTYEEFPGKGDQTGMIKIVRLTGSLSPLINKPVAGDPAFMTLVSTGSLMGSGTVTATTHLPLRRGEPYRVEGAFHELDVTTLNSSAENLGLIHLKSGILNSLAFQFEMGSEKATGKVVGEYHQLVVQKLKGEQEKKKDRGGHDGGKNGDERDAGGSGKKGEEVGKEDGSGKKGDEKKVDKLKSFALREFIIPLNKDHSMPESKRTGKVDYKRDRSRNFSFYLLHSLLTGVKSSFKLGFLLPG